MEYRPPKAHDGASGYYGGIGSRPARPAWSPADRDKAVEGGRVRRRFRMLRLRKSRPRRLDSAGASRLVPRLVLSLIVILVLFQVVLMFFFEEIFLGY